jgi:hypothetical protein
MSIKYLALGMLVASLPLPSQASRSTDPADQAMVDCRMPPQLRSLGRNMTYLAAGRQVRISAADCRVRGGSYDGRGPGEKAGMPLAGSAAVMIGGDESRPGCPGSGTVGGLSAGGTLSVRAAPGTAAARRDKLANGADVFMCDWSADGAWVGVVYASGSSGDCGVSKKVTPSRGYDGPCKSGWVSARYLK